MDHLIPESRQNLVVIDNKENVELYIVVFAVSVDQRMKIKKKKPKERRVLRSCLKTTTFGNLRVIGAHGAVPKGLENGLEMIEIEGRIGTILITPLLRSARMQARMLEN